MSYICDNCGTAKIAGSKPNRVVVETRYTTYATGEGSEIVKEANLCDVCYTIWMKEHPVKVEAEMTKEEMESVLSEAFGVDAHLRSL